MNVSKRARGELRIAANFVRGLIALDEQLGESADLEDLIVRHNATIGELDKVVVERQAAIAAAEEEAEATRTAAEQRAEEIVGVAERIRANAVRDQAAATEIRDQAKAEAAAIVEAAGAEGRTLVAQARQAAAPFEQQVADGKAELEQIAANVGRAQARLDALNTEIAAIKAKY